MGHPGGDKPCGHPVPFHDRGLRGLVLKSLLRELDRVPIPQDTTREIPARTRAPSDPTPGQHFQLGFSSSEEGHLTLLRAKGSEALRVHCVPWWPEGQGVRPQLPQRRWDQTCSSSGLQQPRLQPPFP